MKKIISLVALVIFFSACEKNLDSENYTKKNTGNFPTTVADANQTIIGIYSTLSAAISNSQNTSFYMAELASDDRFGGGGENDKRSEEHTSELQSLMRISYAVFCLKKHIQII